MIRLDNSGDLLSTLGVSLLSFASLSLLLKPLLLLFLLCALDLYELNYVFDLLSFNSEN